MAPDKEAAAMFLVLGYYPILKKKFEILRLGQFLKFIYFNCVICAMYLVLIYMLGIDQIANEYTDLGVLAWSVLLLLGNIVFFLLDRILGMYSKLK